MEIFKPRPSCGWVIPMLLTLICVPLIWGGVAIIKATYVLPSSIFVGIFFIVLGIVLIIPFLLLTIGFFKMHYMLTEKELILRCGIVTFRVLLEDVLEVTVKDLKKPFPLDLPLFNLINSSSDFKNVYLRQASIMDFAWAGYALYNVNYLEIGRVTMCATAAGKNITLIRTPKKVYGITPLQEKEFIFKLQKRIRYAKSISR